MPRLHDTRVTKADGKKGKKIKENSEVVAPPGRDMGGEMKMISRHSTGGIGHAPFKEGGRYHSSAACVPIGIYR